MNPWFTSISLVALGIILLALRFVVGLPEEAYSEINGMRYMDIVGLIFVVIGIIVALSFKRRI